MVGKTNAIEVATITTTSLPVLIFYGQYSGNTYTIPATNRKVSCNPDYFTFQSSGDNAGKFLCNKAFTGNVYIMTTSNMNEAGSGNVLTYTHWKLFVNGSNTQSLTSNQVYHYDSYTGVSFTKNAYTYIQGYCYGNSKNGRGDYLLIVTL